MDLGTIQYNVEANTSDLDRANAAVDAMAENAQEAGKSVDEFGKKITQSAAKSASATSSIRSDYASMAADLKRQADLYGVTSEAAKLRYDIETQAIYGLTAAEKKHLIGLAENIDATRMAAQQADALARAERELADEALRAGQVLNAQAQAIEASLNREIALYGATGRAAKLSYEMQHGALQGLNADQKASINAMAKHLDSLDAGGVAATKLSDANGKAARSFGVFSSGAGQAGIQVQQLVGQIQGGQSAFVAISQQAADLGIVLGAPLAGVMVSLAAVAGGVLFSSLSNTSDVMEQISERTKELVKDFRDFTAAQQAVVSRGVEATLASENIKLEEQKDAVGALKDAISAERAFFEKSHRTGLQFNEQRTESYKKLVAAQLEVVATQKRISDLEDPSGSAKKVKTLSEEAAIIGQTGRAYWELKAAQEGISNARKEDYITAGLSLEQKKKDVKAAEDSASAAKKSANESEQAEKKRLNSIRTVAEQYERQLATLQDLTDAEKLANDVARGAIEVKGGVTGAEYKYLMALADSVDMMTRQKEVFDDVDKAAEKYANTIEDKLAKSFEVFGEDVMKDVGSQFKESERLATDSWERINEAGANVFKNWMDDGKDLFDGLGNLAEQFVSEWANQQFLKPIMSNIQGMFSGAGGSLFAGVGMGGAIAAGAGVLVGAINSWNDRQEKAIEKFKAEFIQQSQSTGTVLGAANEKSDSINSALDQLNSIQDDALGVNKAMLSALNELKSGIGQISALTVRGGITSPNVAGMGTTTNSIGGIAGLALAGGPIGLAVGAIGDLIGGEIGGFISGVVGKISSFVSSKSKKVIDSGIQFNGQSLADVLSDGAADILSYATIQTKKKKLGITTSNKVKTSTEEVSDELARQFGLVFESAGTALEEATKALGVTFDPAKLMVDATKLSLKGLEGDALTEEINNFFSATIDKWAESVASGTNIIAEFQEVGEGAFQTVVRLASQLNVFNRYADLLNLNFSATGVAAVKISQNIADLAGGFDALQSSLGSYYQNFFTDSERTAKQMDMLTTEFNKLGITAIPTTRDAFRDIVEKLVNDTGLLTEESQKTFAGLINLSGAFAELVPATEQMAESARSAADIAKERYDLETRLLQAQGNTAALRERELALLDPSNRALQEQIYAIEDQAKAAEEAAKALEAAAAAAQALKDSASLAYDALVKSADAERDRIAGIVQRATDAKSALDKAVSAEKDSLASAHQDRLDQIKAQQEAESAQAKAQHDAQKAIADARLSSLKEEKSATEDRIKGLQSLFDELNSSVFDMAIKTDTVVRSRRRSAEFEIDTALANARAGRGVPADGRLGDALSALKDNPSALYNSAQEMAHATASLQNKIADLAGLTGNQLTNEEKSLAAIEKQTIAAERTADALGSFVDKTSAKYDDMIANENAQYEASIKSLDLMAQNAQDQLDVLTGISTRTLGVDEAITKFNDALLAADFTNAEQQYQRLDALVAQGETQLNSLLSIDTTVLSLNDAVGQFIQAIQAANSQEVNQQMLSQMQQMVQQIADLRVEQRIQTLNIIQPMKKTANNTTELVYGP